VKYLPLYAWTVFASGRKACIKDDFIVWFYWFDFSSK